MEESKVNRGQFKVERHLIGFNGYCLPLGTQITMGKRIWELVERKE